MYGWRQRVIRLDVTPQLVLPDSQSVLIQGRLFSRINPLKQCENKQYY